MEVESKVELSNEVDENNEEVSNEIDKNKPKNKAKKKKSKGFFAFIGRLFKDYFVLLVAIAIVLSFQIAIVSGSSMYPTLEDRDVLLVNKWSYRLGEPKREDVIVFTPDGLGIDLPKKATLVKRVIGVEGDKIEIANNIVKVNGKEIKEDYVKGTYSTDGTVNMVVPKGCVFVLGDNRPRSNDSRFFGAIKEDNIVGKVVHKF